MVLPIIAQVITVRDAQTHLPVEIAVLVNQNQSHFVTTNADGQVAVDGFSNNDTITLQLIGYESKSFTVAKVGSSGEEILMVPSDISLDQVVVSATRWNQRKRDIPSKITTISPTQVQLQNVQTAADLLGSSGEVYVQKSQLGGGSPMIRGFSANRLLYTVDGVRMNTAIFRSGNLHNVISLDPFAIEHTEVLFGPGSIIYGSDAIGAVMSFRTIEPQLSLTSKPLVKGKATVRYASANKERTAHAHVNAGWKKWAIVSSGTVNYYDDLRMGSNGPDQYLRPFYISREGNQDVLIQSEDPAVQRPTGYHQLNLMQKVRFRPNQDWDLQYGLLHSTTSNIPRYDRLVQEDQGTLRDAEWYYGPQDWTMHNLAISHQGQGIYDQMSMRLAYQSFRESRFQRRLGSSKRTERMDEVSAFSANLDFTKMFAKYSLYYGFESILNDVRSVGQARNIQTAFLEPAASRYPTANWSSYALYISGQHALNAKTNIEAGLRYSMFMLEADFSQNLTFYPLPFREVEINTGAINGSLGIVHRPTDQLSFSAQLTTGFRSPNVDDLGKVFDSEPGAVLVPNPDLQAEYAYNAEIGGTQILGDYLKIDVSCYYTWLRNALIRRRFQLNGRDSIFYDGELSQVQAVQNASAMKVYGLQAGIELKLPAGFSLSGRYNWQVGTEQNEDSDNSRSRHTAPAFGVIRATYNRKNLTIQCYVIFNEEVTAKDLPVEERTKTHIYLLDSNGNLYAPGWVTLNLKGSIQLSKAIALQLGLENLTDQRYRPFGSGIVAPGRNAIIALRAVI
ncbi:MAG: TonB-dependent receptor [Saprospiraceae bacterium]|nr:TonB-dependent receptor [Saprospiraceae bacterium]